MEIVIIILVIIEVLWFVKNRNSRSRKTFLNTSGISGNVTLELKVPVVEPQNIMSSYDEESQSSKVEFPEISIRPAEGSRNAMLVFETTNTQESIVLGMGFEGLEDEYFWHQMFPSSVGPYTNIHGKGLHGWEPMRNVPEEELSALIPKIKEIALEKGKETGYLY
jgi:hypothetical protein